MLLYLTENDEDTIQNHIDVSASSESKYLGMTYEDGMEAVLMVMRGDITAGDAVGEDDV